MITTIGYEKSTPENFVAALQESQIDILVDIRERALSRRPGFSKTALSRAMSEAGIEYIHFRELGDPKAGRAAARAGKFEKFRKIFSEVLASKSAQAALSKIVVIARSKRICLMCYERDPHQCHRKIVSDYLEVLLGCESVHLGVEDHEPKNLRKRRVFHTRQGAAA